MEYGVNGMDVLSIMWLLLTLYIIGLSLFSFRLFFIDKDKRKLMFGLGLLVSSIGFLMLSFGFVKYGVTSYVPNLLYHWGATSYLILLFYVLLERIFSKKITINILFNLFLLTLIISFVILSSTMISTMMFTFFMILGTIISIVFCIILIIKQRGVSSFLFLFSLLSTLVASALLINIQQDVLLTSYVSIFAYFVSYIFIGLIFMVSPLESTSKKTIGSYFSIEKKLETTTKELSETRQTFRNLFDQMIDGVVIVDVKGTILEASNKFFEDIGVTRKELIGKNFLTMKFLDTKTKSKLLKNIVLRLAGKHIPPYEVNVFRKDGTPILYELHAGKIQYKGKSADMAVFRDLTERKKVEKELEQTELKYKTIFEKTGTAIGTFGEDSIITMVNSEFEKLSGYTKEDVEHKMHWYDFITEEYKTKMFAYHKQRSDNHAKPPSEYDCDIIDKHGNKKTVHVNIGILPDSSVRIVSLINITPLKVMQDKLKDMNRNLEHKVNQRTQEIQHLLKQKDEFIGQLGHDLKNPLGPLINLLPILEKTATGEREKQIFQVLQRNVFYMKDLVTKTLELARLNSPNTNFNFELVPMKKQVDNILKNNTFLFQEKQINVKNNISSNLMVYADKLRLDELFTNLLTNAVKYSDNTSTITIQADENDTEIEIFIEDTGIGMTTEQLNRLFDEFYKADSSRHDFHSSGLGMPICKRIVERHGGRIWAQSEGIGKGTIVHFTIPKIHKENTESAKDISTDELHNNIDKLFR